MERARVDGWRSRASSGDAPRPRLRDEPSSEITQRLSSAAGSLATDVIRLQRLAGNAAVSHALNRTVLPPASTPTALALARTAAVQRQTGSSSAPTTPATASSPVGRRTGRPIDDLEREYRSLIAMAREQGRTVAADNLEHFLTGGGRTRSVPLPWLRSFTRFIDAERRNQERFENQLKRRARGLADGSTDSLKDYWDAVVDGSVFTELFYASGMSQLRSTGAFSLARVGRVVTISGTVAHRWFDDYNWNPGSGVFIPRHGFVSDDVGLDLRDAGRGHDYLLENLYTQTLQGQYTINPWYLPDTSTFTWSGP